MVPGCKGQHATLAGQHQKKQQQNIPNPAGVSDIITIKWMPLCKTVSRLNLYLLLILQAR